MNKNDALFQETEIYTDDMYVKGVYPAALTESYGFVIKEGEKSEARSVVVPLEHGNVYVVKFPQETTMLRAAVIEKDPREMAVGESATYFLHCEHDGNSQDLVFFEGKPTEWKPIMYTPAKKREYMVIYTGDKENVPVSVLRYPVLIGRDTDDGWYKPGPQKDLNGTADSWGKWNWTSDEVFEHVYEPLRKANPDYITRLNLGKDQLGKYDMWAYIFEPQDYEQTLFVTGGIHACEMDGYLGLARFIELMVNEDGSNEGLHYLRTRVKIVLIPIVNVCSVSEGQTYFNGRGAQLNSDFRYHKEAETINVIWLLEQYKDEVAALIDYHCCGVVGYDVYYQFSIQAPNSKVCRRVTNHVYEDLKKRGLATTPTNLRLIPGKYEKRDTFIQGYAWARLGIPTVTVEHQQVSYDGPHSALSLELAVEYYGNFMIQTALAKLKLIK